MKEQFVSYEIALKLKELGFDEPCLSIFAKDLNFNLTMFGQKFDNKIETSKDFACDIHLEDVLCPLWQQVIDWFREKHNVDICINPVRYVGFVNSSLKLVQS